MIPRPSKVPIPSVGWVSQLPVVGVSSKRKVSQMLTSEVLNRAADLIEERGWGQGTETWSDQGGGLCLEGGIKAAIGLTCPTSDIGASLLAACPAARAVHAYLALSPLRMLYRWNDHPDRTAAEVVEVLRAAAVIEQARESQPSVVSA